MSVDYFCSCDCFFGKGYQICNFYLEKIFFQEKINFDKNSFIWFLSLIYKIFKFWQENVCMVLKIAFHMSGGLFWRKVLLQKNLLHFFWTLSEKLSKFGELFSGDLSKMQSKPAEGLQGGKDKVWEKFCSVGINSCHE